MSSRRTFWLLFLASLRESKWKAGAELIGAIAPTVVAFVRAVKDASQWEVFAWMVLAVVVGVLSVYIHAKDVWTSEVAARLRAEADLHASNSNRAMLKLSHRRDFPMWWAEQSWLRVCVGNLSETAQATNVEVAIIEMVPNGLPLNVLPSRLGRKDGNEPCLINPGGKAFFDVVRGVKGEAGALQLWTVVSPGQKFVLTADDHWSSLLTIRVTAENAAPRTVRFRLKRIGDDEPELEEVTRL